MGRVQGRVQKMSLECVFDMIVRFSAFLALRQDHTAKNEVLALESLVLLFPCVGEK